MTIARGGEDELWQSVDENADLAVWLGLSSISSVMRGAAMKNISPEGKLSSNSRRNFSKRLIMGLSIIPLTILGSPVSGLSQRRGRRRKSQQVRILQSSPITIGGGGSVKVVFDMSYYARVAAGTFLKMGDELTTVLILNEDHDLLHNIYQVVEGKDCTVTIQCKYQAERGTIVIRSRPPVGQVPSRIEVAFDEAIFPYDAGRRRHYNGGLKITDPVVARNNVTGDVTTYPVPSNGKCGIVALNKA